MKALGIRVRIKARTMSTIIHFWCFLKKSSIGPFSNVQKEKTINIYV